MEGYIKTKVFGEDHSFQFDLKTMGWIVKELEVNIQSLFQTIADNPYQAYPVILYYGKKRVADSNKEAFDVEFDEVYKWIEKEEDGILSENIMKVVKVFLESAMATLPKKAQEIAKQEAGKSPNVKKSTGKQT